MTRNKTVLFFTFVVSLWYAPLQGQELTVGTYNIRFANPEDEGNLWKDRVSAVADLIRFHDFDVCGTQEGLPQQLKDLNKALPEYAHYGLGRDEGKDAGEHSAIFYKKSKFTLLDKGDFWLSETPDQPSFGWDATEIKRICSWVYLEDKENKRRFYFFNAHYDHRGTKAREESSKLILAKIATIAKGAPAVFTGDLNGGQDSPWYKTLVQSSLIYDTQFQAAHPYKNNASYNAFGSAESLASNEIIDHIFVTKDFQSTKWGVLTDTYRGKFPSDHCPILCVLYFK